MAETKQFGGWYNNPDQGGKNMRWWGDYGWTNGEDPTGGAGQSVSTSGGETSDWLTEFANLFGESAASPIEIPDLTVKTWEEYEADALAELTPYYERILKEEGGDVEKAKARLEQDYQRGIRMKREDWETATKAEGPTMIAGETPTEYYNRTKGSSGTSPSEGISLFSNLNKRGVSQSGIANVEGKKMVTSQQARQEAIDRALKRYEEEAGITKSRGIEDANTNWERRQFELTESKKTDAATLARQKRSDEISTQEIERENLLRKAINNTYA